MAFDGIITAAVAVELNSVLTGGKIEKIYQPEPDELLFHIGNRRSRYRLFLTSNGANPRIHLIETYDSSPQAPTGFCMLLRKHIQGSRIFSILQKDSERIVEITLETINEMGYSRRKKLIVEIMGKHSNIILIDGESGKIIDSIKRVSFDVNRYRQTLPGMAYVYPPDQGKKSFYTLSPADFSAIVAAAGDEDSDAAARLLMQTVQGVGPAAARELLHEAGMRAVNGFDPAQALFRIFQDLARQLQAGPLPARVWLDDQACPLDFHILPLSIYEDCSVRQFDSISAGVDYFYANRTSTNRIRQKSADLIRSIQTALDRLYLKKQRLLEDLRQAENADQDRLKGELLTAALHTVQERAASVDVFNYYDNTTTTIRLDPRLTPAQNAQRYYKKYHKARTAVTEKNVQLTETDQEIRWLEAELSFLESASAASEIDAIRQELTEAGYVRRRKSSGKQSKEKASPTEYRLPGGARVLVGRNNKENDYLTLRLADNRDLWFHTRDIPGSHVILFRDGREEPEEQEIRQAAAIAAWHSKGRNSENVPVDYTLVRHVKKPSGARPGMVIFTNNRTVYVNPALPEDTETKAHS